MKKQLLSMGMALTACTLFAADYAKYKEDILKKDDLIRFYTFEEGIGPETANMVKLDASKKSIHGGPLGSMTIKVDPVYGWKCTSPDGKKPEYQPVYPAWSCGRFSGKSSLKVGNSDIAGWRMGVSCAKMKDCTFATWIRTRVIDSNKWSTNILKLGNKYNTGFSLDAGVMPWAKDGFITLGFGSNKKELRQGLQGGKFEPGMWHFVAFTLDGRKARLFVDGELRKEVDYHGYITPVINPDFPTQDYIYEVHNGREWSHSTPFIRVGNQGKNSKSPARYDMDELMIFTRALPADEIASLYNAGKPEEAIDVQKKFSADLSVRENALDKVVFDIPDDSSGYFRTGTVIPVKVSMPVDPYFKDRYKVKISLNQMQGPFHKEVIKDIKPGETVSQEFSPAECAIYFVHIELQDAKGNVMKQMLQDRPVAIVPPAPKGGLTKLNPMGLWAFNNDFSYDTPIRRMGVGEDWLGDKKFVRGPEEFARRQKITPELRTFLCFGYPGKNQLLSKMTPEKRAEWDKYYDGVVEAAKKMNAFAIEFCSEPDCDRSTPDAVGEAVNLSAPKFRKAFKEIKLVPAGACPTGLPWTAAMLKTVNLNLIDGISYHSYRGNPLMQCNFGNPASDIMQVTAPYEKKKKLELWNTESGYDFLPRIGNRPMTAEEARAIGYPSKLLNGYEMFTTSMPCAPEEEAAALQVHAIICELYLGFKIYVKCIAPGSGRSPSLQGIAWTALAGQILNHQTRVTKLPLASLNMGCFIIHQDNGSRIAAVFGMKEETLNFKVDPNKSYKTMDMLGNFGSIKSDKNGIITIKAKMNPVYIFDVPNDMKEAVILNLSLPKDMPENGILKGVLHVTNDFDTPLAGTISAVQVRGMTITPEEANLKLASKSKKDIPFTITGISLKNKSYVARFEFKHNNKLVAAAARAFQSPGTIVKIPQFKKKISLDGNEAKWKNVPEYICETLEDVSHGQPNFACLWLPHWENKDDLSFSVKLAWVKNDGIYFFMKVKDDHVMPKPEKHPYIFVFDSLELFTDIRPLKDLGKPVAKGADQTLIAPNNTTELKPVLLEYAASRRQPAQVKVDCVSKTIPGGYILEGRIQPLSGSGFKVLAGSQLHLDFTINDTDSMSQLRKAAMTLNGIFNNYTCADRWGKYELSLDSVD